jgi:glycosyltransferase involved in cell wall biosynthesis
MTHYAVVVPARNEEKHLKKTLEAIRDQTIPPNQIIVVNDGSIDSTPEIASKLSDTVIMRQDRGYSAIGTREMPKTLNEGLAKVSPEATHILICGADCILPPNYVETILSKMEEDPLLVLASGHNNGDEIGEYDDSPIPPPRGTRLVRRDFWEKASHLQYPRTYGFETWLNIKALSMGYHIKRIPGLITKAQRTPRNTSIKIALSRGRGMYEQGYIWYYALARSLRYFFIKPSAGIKMLVGYMSSHGPKLDTAYYLTKQQKTRFWWRVRDYLRWCLK